MRHKIIRDHAEERAAMPGELGAAMILCPMILSFRGLPLRPDRRTTRFLPRP